MLEMKTTFTEKKSMAHFSTGNSDLGNCKLCLLVSMIPRLTLNVGMIAMITGLATTEGKPLPFSMNRSSPQYITPRGA